LDENDGRFFNLVFDAKMPVAQFSLKEKQSGHRQQLAER